MPTNFVRYLFPVIAGVILEALRAEDRCERAARLHLGICPGRRRSHPCLPIGSGHRSIEACAADHGRGEPVLPGVVTGQQVPVFDSCTGRVWGKSHEQVAAYELVGRAGELKLLNRQSTRGSASATWRLTPQARRWFVANYATGSVASLPVQQGRIAGRDRVLRATRGLECQPRAAGRSPRSLCGDQSGQPICLRGGLGARPVMAYRLDAATAKLSPSRQPFVQNATRCRTAAPDIPSQWPTRLRHQRTRQLGHIV